MSAADTIRSEAPEVSGSPAVLLLDLQEGVAANVFDTSSERARYCRSVLELIELAADRAWPCIRVDVGFRTGYPEVSPRNVYFTGVKSAGRLQLGSDATQPMRELEEAVHSFPRVIKPRIGALVGTELEHLLRGTGAAGLLLAGLVTRGAVLSTACHAADLDYRVAVVGDACFDPDVSVHESLLANVIPLRASVMDLRALRATATDSLWGLQL